MDKWLSTTGPSLTIPTHTWYLLNSQSNHTTHYMSISQLDEGHVFETGKVSTYAQLSPNSHNNMLVQPMLVCGNTASMVQESWMKDHFKVRQSPYIKHESPL
eukprot:408748-Amorphochlora_amoeboformis.AAC.1